MWKSNSNINSSILAIRNNEFAAALCRYTSFFAKSDLIFVSLLKHYENFEKYSTSIIFF